MAEVADHEARQLVQEDARLVAAAANSGRISVDNVPQWMMAMKADRAGTRRTLASLAPVRADMRRAAGIDPEVEAVHSNVMGRLGLSTGKPGPARTVEAASGFGRQPGEVLPNPLSQPDIPPPVVLKRGKPQSEWTKREIEDHLQRKLGRKFWPGTRPSPPGDEIYLPSPADVSRFDEATGQWIPKNPYREI
jgi:hypothetical protein